MEFEQKKVFHIHKTYLYLGTYIPKSHKKVKVIHFGLFWGSYELIYKK